MDSLAVAFSERLRRVVDEKYPTRAAFQKEVGYSRATVSPWLSLAAPDIPRGRMLARVSAVTRWSLDYLMFGEGPVYRGVSRSQEELGRDLHEYLSARLRTTPARKVAKRGDPFDPKIAEVVTQTAGEDVAYLPEPGDILEWATRWATMYLAEGARLADRHRELSEQRTRFGKRAKVAPAAPRPRAKVRKPARRKPRHK